MNERLTNELARLFYAEAQEAEDNGEHVRLLGIAAALEEQALVQFLHTESEQQINALM